jgi:hypothetical protein
VAHTL